GPAGRSGRYMHHMGDLAGRGASLEPLLDFQIEIDGARAGERLGAPDVVQQNLGEPPVAHRAECFRHAAEPVAGRGPWQAERARAIGQELGIEKALRGAGELEGKVWWRKCYDLVGGFVVVEIIVIVLHEENRS